MTVPYGTRLLLITTAAPQDRQFAGILKACRELGKKKACCHLVHRGRRLELSRRRVLSWVVVSGHGAKSAARIGPAKDVFRPGSSEWLTPSDLSLPPNCRLLLLSCFQGRERQRASWSAKTGVPFERVLGCEDDTESALSTLFLLHVLADGTDRLLYWFDRWIEINNRYRPHFALARRIYQQNHGRFLDTLTALRDTVETSCFDDFLKPASRYEGYLDALA
jgi:hypothetical protein